MKGFLAGVLNHPLQGAMDALEQRRKLDWEAWEMANRATPPFWVSSEHKYSLGSSSEHLHAVTLGTAVNPRAIIADCAWNDT